MKTSFLAVDLWNMFENGFEEPENEDGLSEVEKKEFKEGRQRDANVLSMLYRVVADSVFSRPMTANKANEAWEFLRKEYQGDLKVEDAVEKEEGVQEVEVGEILKGGLMKENHHKSVKFTRGAAMMKMTVRSKGSRNATIAKGNGYLVNAKGKGAIGVETKRGSRLIRDVMHVPDLDQNLLSVRQLLENGYTLHFENDICVIRDKRAGYMLIVKLKMKNISFPLSFKHLIDKAFRMVANDLRLWHKRLGHLNFQGLELLQQKNMVYQLPKIEEKYEICEGYALDKHHRQPIPKGIAWRAKQPLELVHTDVCGPMQTPSHSQNRYFILVIDDFTRMTWIHFMRQKYKVFTVSKKFKIFVEKQSGHFIKVLRSDNSKEYTSKEFDKFCQDEGVERQLTIGYIPRQNGVSERKNQTIMDIEKAMLHEKRLPKSFWAEAIYTSIYLTNRCPTKAVLNKTPIEAWNGRKPLVKHLKVFGCIYYAQVPKEKRHELDEASEKFILIGYSSQSKGYKLYNLMTKTVIISRDVFFDENATWKWENEEVERNVTIPITLPQNSANENVQNEENASQPSSPPSSPSSPTSSSSSTSSSPSSTPRKMWDLNDIYMQDATYRCKMALQGKA
ncbi:Uncharacterized protein Adt_23592 [Abeliophyllum distichum]|uniref:Integrase catalytic domain-containing protein n=1 Tax=Abeliophyllum distichum TaxID=126358 RepID=A0ABD1SBB7_9LAMI